MDVYFVLVLSVCGVCLGMSFITAAVGVGWGGGRSCSPLLYIQCLGSKFPMLGCGQIHLFTDRHKPFVYLPCSENIQLFFQYQPNGLAILSVPLPRLLLLFFFYWNFKEKRETVLSNHFLSFFSFCSSPHGKVSLRIPEPVMVCITASSLGVLCN